MVQQLQGKQIDEIIKYWNQDMEKQITSFTKDVNKLKDAELQLYENLDHIHVIQDTSKEL